MNPIYRRFGRFFGAYACLFALLLLFSAARANAIPWPHAVVCQALLESVDDFVKLSRDEASRAVAELRRQVENQPDRAKERERLAEIELALNERPSPQNTLQVVRISGIEEIRRFLREFNVALDELHGAVTKRLEQEHPRSRAVVAMVGLQLAIVGALAASFTNPESGYMAYDPTGSGSGKLILLNLERLGLLLTSMAFLMADRVGYGKANRAFQQRQLPANLAKIKDCLEGECRADADGRFVLVSGSLKKVPGEFHSLVMRRQATVWQRENREEKGKYDEADLDVTAWVARDSVISVVERSFRPYLPGVFAAFVDERLRGASPRVFRDISYDVVFSWPAGEDGKGEPSLVIVYGSKAESSGNRRSRRTETERERAGAFVPGMAREAMP